MNQHVVYRGRHVVRERLQRVTTSSRHRRCQPNIEIAEIKYGIHTHTTRVYGNTALSLFINACLSVESVAEGQTSPQTPQAASKARPYQVQHRVAKYIRACGGTIRRGMYLSCCSPCIYINTSAAPVERVLLIACRAACLLS